MTRDFCNSFIFMQKRLVFVKFFTGCGYRFQIKCKIGKIVEDSGKKFVLNNKVASSVSSRLVEISRRLMIQDPFVQADEKL